jgi:UDP-N-acetylglucosamine 3-dehydrogenase
LKTEIAGREAAPHSLQRCFVRRPVWDVCNIDGPEEPSYGCKVRATERTLLGSPKNHVEQSKAFNVDDRKESMDSVRWGIIGVGRFGLIHARVAASLPGVQLAGLCNRNAEKLSAAGARFPGVRLYSDYRQLVDSSEIDAVSVTTHWREHFEVAAAALRGGKHVLLEKPMAATREECQKLIAIAASAPGFLMVGHICRFDPRITLAQQAIAEGRIGRIISMHAKRNLPVAAGSLRLDKISPLMGDGIHDADLMMWFVGRAPSRIYAHHVRVDPFQHPDIGWAMLQFGSDAVGVVETVWRLPANVPTVIDAKMEVIGTEGRLVIDCAHTGLEILDPRGLQQPDTVYWPIQHGKPVGALANEMAYFVDCIRHKQTPTVVPLPDASRAVAVMELAEQSATAGWPIDVAGPL